MLKRTLTTLLLLIASLPVARAADFYVEPRVSLVAISGTLNIGDLGRKTGSDVSRFAPGLGLGYHVSPRLSVEARYTRIARFTQSKVVPNGSIFPTEGVILPFVRTYDLSQRTDLLTLAVPFTAVAGNRFSLQLTPLLDFATADIRLQETVDVLPAVFPPTFRPLRVNRTGRDVRLGGEITAGYTLTPTARLKLHYTYAPLQRVDAHLFGFGVEWRF